MTVALPRSLWKSGYKAQFDYLNKKFFGGASNQPEGWTWHHMPHNGQMQLVPSGLHSVIDHAGGMARGRWGYI
ncbi:MAG: HNH endonuclease [Planctomycetes bacterium]|nr:HNH endonuclease [Planctomycetota bacterium]